MIADFGNSVRNLEWHFIFLIHSLFGDKYDICATFNALCFDAFYSSQWICF